MITRFLLCVSRCNSAKRAGCPDPVLPRVCDHRAAIVARRTAAHCARPGVFARNSAGQLASDPFQGLTPIRVSCTRSNRHLRHAKAAAMNANESPDFVEIQQLLARYSRSLDTRDWELY